jgi:hypothetical protein
VKAFVAAGLDRDALCSSSRSSEGGGRAADDEVVDGRRGDPSLVLYADCSSSLSNDRASSGSKAFSDRGDRESLQRWNLLRIHFPASNPGSRRYFFSACVSSRNKIPTTTPQETMTVHTRFGSRYGCAAQIESAGNTVGQLSCGFARAPPSEGPRIDLINNQLSAY